MAKKSVLSDASAFKFKDVDLSGAVISWDDTLAERLAGQEYLKRDGAEQEDMGSRPGAFTFRCVFIGEGWAKKYRDLVSSIRKDPKGQLVHPILGTIDAACTGITGASVTPQQAVDTITFTIGFVEDSLSTAFATEQQQGADTKAADVSDNTSAANDAVAALVTLGATPNGATMPPGVAAISATSVAMNAATASYTASALAASSSLSPDLTLASQLAAAGTATQAFISALIADTTSSDASKYDALVAAELVYSSCLELDATIAALRPLIVTYVVPTTTSLAAIASLFYGSDAEAKMDEMLTLNRIQNPAAIPFGTILQLTAPTV